MAVWADTTVFSQIGQYRRLRQDGIRHAGSGSCVTVSMKNSIAGYATGTSNIPVRTGTELMSTIDVVHGRFSFLFIITKLPADSIADSGSSSILMGPGI